MNIFMKLWTTLLLGLGLVRAQEPATGFGLKVMVPFGFCGRVYEVSEGLLTVNQPTPDKWPSRSCKVKLPDFDRLHPVGKIYTTELNIEPHDFREGFPGVTNRVEWFAIDYVARFWVGKAGKYSFSLQSDDGSLLYVDGQRIIDNDCVHAPITVEGNARLQSGIHEIRVSYFQGPPWQVALVLMVKPPHGDWRVFDTDDFMPPANQGNLDMPADPCQPQKHAGTAR